MYEEYLDVAFFLKKKLSVPSSFLIFILHMEKMRFYRIEYSFKDIGLLLQKSPLCTTMVHEVFEKNPHSKKLLVDQQTL